MATNIRGTNRADSFVQGNLAFLDIRTFGGDDQIQLNRDDDLGGDNFVDAGAGNDLVFNQFEDGNQILLGKGNDIYAGNGFSFFNVGDVVDGGSGNDQFFFETLLSTYIGGKGNDVFTSTGNRNRIDGGAGNDTISYAFRHEDSVKGDTGVTIDLAFGAAETGSLSREQLFNIENAIGSENGDAIGGTIGANALNGLGGRDEILGFAGNDQIIGGLDGDIMSGGTGADTFIFTNVNDSSIVEADVIVDFSAFEGDLIDLRQIDGNSEISGNQAFNFIGDAAFSGQAGELRFNGTFILGDMDGSGIADVVIELEGVASLTEDSFLL